MKKIVFPAGYAGRNSTCPKCHANIPVPGQAVVDDPRPKTEVKKPSKLKPALVALSVVLVVGIAITSWKLLPPPPPPIEQTYCAICKAEGTENIFKNQAELDTHIAIEHGLDMEKLAKMVGMVVGGYKVEYADKVREQPHAFLRLTDAEFAALPPEVRSQCFTVGGDKIIMDKHGLNGTCFIISPDGYAITNEHVIAKIKESMDASNMIKKMEQRMAYVKVEPKLWIILSGKQHSAELVFVSDIYDFAILKVEGLDNVDYFRMSSSEKLKRQTKVVTLGFPASSVASWGKNPTEEERKILEAKQDKAKKITDWFLNSDFEFILKEGVVSVVKDRPGRGRIIEHDATVNGGNSGGPLVSSPDMVVRGINTWKRERTGKQRTDGTYLSIMMITIRGKIKEFVPNSVWVE